MYRLTRPTLLAAICLVCSMLACAVESRADEVDTQRAMQSLQRTTWYDSGQKQYKTPVVGTEEDNSIRSDGWLGAPIKPASQRDWNWFKNWNWGNWGVAFGEFFTSIVLILLGGVLLLVVLGLIYYGVRDYLPSPRRAQAIRKSVEIDLTRVEDLPFEVSMSERGDPLSEAQRLMKAGKFDQAAVYLYGYMLLALDNAHKIHLVKGKTNRMYLREMHRETTRLRAIVEMAMLAFENVYFGKHQLTADHCQLLWSQLDEFHRLLVDASNDAPPQSVEVATA